MFDPASKKGATPIGEVWLRERGQGVRIFPRTILVPVMLIATAACSTEQIPVASPAQIPVVSPAQMPVAAISKGPVPARRSGLTGSALYAMTLTRAGDVVGLELVKSSDNAKVAPEAERR